MDEPSLAQRLLSQGTAGLARAITLIENGTAPAAFAAELAATGAEPAVFGVTGAPGAGKSTLIDQLVASFRHRGQTVAVVAVDPTSPVSGGALLGDRIRFQRHAGDSGVFLRSMGARGHLGGLVTVIEDVIAALGAFGFEVVLLETVGVGQSELQVFEVAPTVVLVLSPDAADPVQLLKAGVTELADVICVNKSDLPGAARALQACRAAASQAPAPPPVVATIATSGAGIEELTEAMLARRRDSRGAPRAGRGGPTLRHRVLREVSRRAVAGAERLLDEDPELASLLAREANPAEIARRLLERLATTPDVS